MWWWIGVGLLFVACKESEEYSEPQQSRVVLELEVAPMAIQPMAIEDEIHDVNLYFFGYGDLYYHFYCRSTSDMALQMLSGRYRLYVVANARQNLGDLTEAELKSYCYDVGEDGAVRCPMVATELVDIEAPVSSLTVRVKRGFARIHYRISVASEVASKIKLRSVQFVCVPKIIQLFRSEETLTDKTAFFDEAPIGIDDRSFVGEYRMLENCQGRTKNPSYATYMKILAEGIGGETSKPLEYMVYLGEGSFDVKRNTNYRMNLVICSEDEIKTTAPEPLYYGTANCHICEGSRVALDVTAYKTSAAVNYAYTGIPAGEQYNPVAAKILYASLPWNRISLSLERSLLTVDVDWTSGGHVILVAVVDEADNILWSFLIWHPKTSIEDEAYTNKDGEKFLMMDRNLGEMRSGTQDDAHPNNCSHAVYEWGRKDPFWYQNQLFYFDASSSMSYWHRYVKADKESVVRIEDLHKNPMTFYGDGYVPDPRQWGDPNNNLKYYGWSGAKSVYDPCPEGYRVPNMKTWTGFDTHSIGGFIFGNLFMRDEYDRVGTFYPQGFTAEWVGGAFGTGVGKIGRYWTSEMRYMYFVGDNSIYYSKGYEVQGNKVRCAREVILSPNSCVRK